MKTSCDIVHKLLSTYVRKFPKAAYKNNLRKKYCNFILSFAIEIAYT